MTDVSDKGPDAPLYFEGDKIALGGGAFAPAPGPKVYAWPVNGPITAAAPLDDDAHEA